MTASPGCDTELLTSSGNMDNPKIITQLRNSSKENLTNKNNLALSPQESDYFYDDYVDYPFNASLVEGNELNSNKNRVQHSNGVPNNISGKYITYSNKNIYIRNFSR